MKSYAPRTATGRALAAIRSNAAAQYAPSNPVQAPAASMSPAEAQPAARAVSRGTMLNKLFRKRYA